jgi:hypothetical protein
MSSSIFCVAMGSSALAGSSISSTSGLTASARAMQSRCCCPPERPSALRSEPIAHLVPERRGRSDLSTISSRSAPPRDAVHPRAVGHVVVDRLRERVGLLEHHPHPLPEEHHVLLLPVHGLAVQPDVALVPGVGDEVVHPVDRAQEGRLPASRRADERGHAVPRDLHRDPVERLRGPVVEGEILRDHRRRGVGLQRRPGRGSRCTGDTDGRRFGHCGSRHGFHQLL